jgi:hypothetical protein
VYAKGYVQNRLYGNITVTKQLRLILPLLLLAQISGCTVMSKADCENGHWERIGHGVGSSGDRDRHAAFVKRADICATYGHGADQDAFDRGHEAGIEQYCDIPSAVELGTRGVSPSNSIDTCPEYDYPGFASAYRSGRRLYDLNRRVQEAQTEIDHLETEAYEYQRERSQLRDDVSSGELTDEQVHYAQRRSRQLRRDIRSIRDSIYHHRGRAQEYQRAADNYARLLDVEYGDGRPEY